MEKPEGNQFILLTRWGANTPVPGSPTCIGEGEKPSLADFRPKINRDAGSWTPTA